MKWLNYHHLYYFWTVMREGSITAACKRLHLVPATVSSQIGKLEETLNGKLFIRVGRNLKPTEFGHHVFRYADEIFSIGRELMDGLDTLPMAGRIPLRIGVVDVLPKIVVRMLLEPALKIPESIRLICSEDKKENLLAELSLHKLDAVLSDSPMGSDLNVKAYNHVLGGCGVSFFATEELAEPLRPDFPDSLNGAPLLLPMELTTLRTQLDVWFDSLNIKPVVVGEFNDSALLKAFGQKGDGVFAAPSIIEDEVRRQYQVQVIGRTGAVRENFYVISIERIIHHPAVAVISQEANKNFQFAGNVDDSLQEEL
ncbi:MAG TPA: transcriptional activator NhaR [Desulfobulbus sp.]|nr:transcriptional activator NhaR [Desulfobulbus sp.]